MYPVQKIAHYIVNECSQREHPVSNLKLQKMLYFAWIEYFKSTHRCLFNERIEAWQFGPVVPLIYDEYCAYGGLDIDKRYTDLDDIAPSDTAILDEIISKYSAISVSRLVSMTHEPGKPWNKVFSASGCRRERIPFDLIEELECKVDMEC